MLLLCLSGCATKSAVRAQSLSRSIGQQGRAFAETKARLDGVKGTPGDAEAAWQATLIGRSNELLRVQQEFDTELTAFSKRLIKLTGQAQFLGISQTGIRWAGLAAGIAGAAASAASPANVVWVTALSGFAGAANGFGAAADAEGFSRAVVAAFLKPVVEEVAKMVTEFSLAEAQEYMWQKDGANFWNAIKTQNRSVGVLRAAHLRLLQPPIVELKGSTSVPQTNAAAGSGVQ